MTLIDPISDMITRIRNAQMRSLNKVMIPGSKYRERILEVLKNKGYTYDKATKEWKAPEIETIWCKMSEKWIIPKPKVTIYPTVVYKNTD